MVFAACCSQCRGGLPAKVQVRPAVSHQKHAAHLMPFAFRAWFKPDQHLRRCLRVKPLKPLSELPRGPPLIGLEPCRCQPGMAGQGLPASHLGHCPIPPPQPPPAQVQRVGPCGRFGVPKPRIEQIPRQPQVCLYLADAKPGERLTALRATRHGQLVPGQVRQFGTQPVMATRP